MQEQPNSRLDWWIMLIHNPEFCCHLDALIAAYAPVTEDAVLIGVAKDIDVELTD